MSNVSCCVLGCKSKSNKDKSLHFHVFPKKGSAKVEIIDKLNQSKHVDIQEAWIQQLKINQPIKKTMKVCSNHFEDVDYLPRKDGKLKRNAVPSKELPGDDSQEIKQRTSSRKRNSIKEEEDLDCREFKQHRLSKESSPPPASPRSIKSLNGTKSSNMTDSDLQTHFEIIKDDKFDIIGKNLANKLRELPDDVAIVTEKMFYDIMFEAKMGNVTKFTKVMLHDTSSKATRTIASIPILQTLEKKSPNKELQ